MPQQRGEDAFNLPTLAQTAHIGFAVACGLACLTEPFTAYGFGKAYFNAWSVGLGFLILCGFVVVFPDHGGPLGQYLSLWLALVAIQSALARWKHWFGRREITVFVGYPLIAKILPMPLGLARRVVTPVALFGLGLLLGDHALSLLVRSSAVGQAVLFGFIYAASAADDDARSDLNILMRRRH